MRTKTILVLALLLGAVLLPGQALAQDARNFPDTGYTVEDDAIWAFFQAHGGADTFGAPISREMAMQGLQLQIFQNAALQIQTDGSVQPVQLTGDGWLPYTSFGGLTVPKADAAVAFVAPTPDQPNYDARIAAYTNATVAPPFAASYDLTLLGLPTSNAKPDPNNPNFVYQRFQNGILLADASSGSVGMLPLGEYLKDVATGQNLPGDLAVEATRSALYRHYSADEAFVPDAA
jgi:hypothetical protein